MTDITIALDAMGGDYGLDVVVPAALAVLAKHRKVKLILVGDENSIQQHLAHGKHQRFADRLSVRHASEVVTMDDPPKRAYRSKKDSSMRVAVDLVKQGEAGACVSAGNTGALMTIASLVLGRLPDIDRPAIITQLPTQDGITRVLDLGANVDSCAEHLFQFAIMGSVLTAAVDGIDAPTVGLLNIGEEEIKGNDQVKRTAHMLTESGVVNYIGYVEGDDIFKGIANVIVCDGFVGNVALKTSEGTAKLITYFMKSEFNRNAFTKFLGLMALPVLRRIKERANPSRYNGASLVGLQGIVIKSHGGTDVVGFTCAIEQAIAEVKHDVPKLIGEVTSELVGKA